MVNPEFVARTKNIFDLSGRVAVVTGAAGGLGRIFTLALVSFGARVVLVSRNSEKLKNLEDEIRGIGGEAFAIATDVTKEDQVERMVDETVNRFGKIDILVNNAGIILRYPAEEMSREKWQEVMETNVTGTFLCSQKVGKVMIPKKRGKIINLSSIRGRFGRPKDYVAYCTSKGGVDSLTRAFACEWGKYNIQVNAIAPGMIDTSKEGGLGNPQRDPTYTQSLVNRIPLHRWGEPEDLVGCGIFLASDASNFVNGHILYVDGGYAISA